MSAIHELRLQDGSRQTVKEFFKLLTPLYDEASRSDQTLRILIVQKSSFISMTSFMDDVRVFISQQRRMPLIVPAHFAIVLDKPPFLDLLSHMLKMMRHQDRVKFFHLHEYEQALEWLVSA
ncbi:STAS/SEC14 domain-containing protein [bacterium]|nr:STAS/SEC14 domain-containing protein [bacterium]